MKKPLLIGCGAVALLTLVAVVAVVRLGVFGVGSLVEGSNASSKKIFGDTPPKGFLAMGLNFDTSIQDPLVMMLHPKSKVMLFARKTQLSYEQVSDIQFADNDALIEVFDAVYEVDEGEAVIPEGSQLFSTPTPRQMTRKNRITRWCTTLNLKTATVTPPWPCCPIKTAKPCF